MLVWGWWQVGVFLVVWGAVPGFFCGKRRGLAKNFLVGGKGVGEFYWLCRGSWNFLCG